MTSEVNGNQKMTSEVNGNHCEYSNVTVVNSRCVNYLLTKLRNKDTQAKVSTVQKLIPLSCYVLLQLFLFSISIQK